MPKDGNKRRSFGYSLRMTGKSVSKNCGYGPGTDCWSTQNGGVYKQFDGTPGFNWNAAGAYYKLILNDGSFLAFSVDDQFQKFGSGALEYIFGNFYIDINGDKGPNTEGKDVFSFYLTKYGIIPRGTPDEKMFALDQYHTFGDCTTAWVITKGNMDYLRKDVSW